MIYYKYNFTVEPLEPFRPLLQAQLGDALFETFVDTEVGFEAYIAEGDWNSSIDNVVLEGFPDVKVTSTKEKIVDKNWNEEWEKNFDPITISDQCHIRATFHPEKKDIPFEIVIDPKMSFGTGHHQTTTMMVQLILEMDLTGKTILDMGAGTAVLAVLAGMKNARDITAIDIDEWAYLNAVENVKLNNFERIKVLEGGAELLGEETYDVIFANINRNILLNDIQHYVKVLNPNSKILFSGFYKEDMPLIEQECNKHGLTFDSMKNIDNWVALQFKF